jgi:4-amino-4-deoxychorismate lyase
VERTTRSLEAFQWDVPDWEEVHRAAALLAQSYPVLRITVFADGRVLILGRSLPPSLEALHTEGITAWVADSPTYSRPLPGHKTGNYLGCWLALQAAQRHRAQEAILLNDEHHWLETSTGNLWGWGEGTWWTPPLTTGILPGVMRSRLIHGLQAQGQSVHTQPWTIEQVQQFTFLAYSNSVLEIVPIHTTLQGTTSIHYEPQYEKVQALNAAWKPSSPRILKMS